MYLNALDAERIPDPTTAGDFCRRFSALQIECLMDVFNDNRLKAWRREGQLMMEVHVPANTRATIYVPADGVDSVSESGVSAANAPGVQFLRNDEHRIVFEVGSGVYRFQSQLPNGSNSSFKAGGTTLQ